MNDTNWGDICPIARLEGQLPNFNFSIYNPLTDSVESKSSEDFRGKWLVLMFYPADFTFVCPTELKDLNKQYEEIQSMGNVEVAVVSVDSVFSHKAWIESEPLLKDFKFAMISDRTTMLADYFGVLNEETGNAERGTFIISPEGVIKTIEIHTDPVGRSAKELVRKLYGLKFVNENEGHVCPASWDSTMKTMKPKLKNIGKAEDSLV